MLTKFDQSVRIADEVETVVQVGGRLLVDVCWSGEPTSRVGLARAVDPPVVALQNPHHDDDQLVDVRDHVLEAQFGNLLVEKEEVEAVEDLAQYVDAPRALQNPVRLLNSSIGRANKHLQ